jgi:flagellar biosynthesis chaperone FliJ
MNADRRKRLTALKDELDALKEKIDEIGGEERGYFDNMPENMQQGDKGQRAEEVADLIDQACNSIDEALSGLDSAIE